VICRKGYGETIVTHVVAFFPGVSYEVCSNTNGLCDTAIVVVSVTEEGTGPQPIDDEAEVDEGRKIFIDVLDNDLDPEGLGLTINSVSDPPHGSSTVSPEGRIDYVPDGVSTCRLCLIAHSSFSFCVSHRFFVVRGILDSIRLHTRFVVPIICVILRRLPSRSIPSELDPNHVMLLTSVLALYER